MKARFLLGVAAIAIVAAAPDVLAQQMARGTNRGSTTVDAHGTCKVVKNNHASGTDVLIPFKSADEWSRFRSYTPPGITFEECCTPQHAEWTEGCGGGWSGYIVYGEDFLCPQRSWGGSYEIANYCEPPPPPPPISPPAVPPVSPISPPAATVPPVPSPPVAPTCGNPSGYYYYYNPDVEAAGVDARSHWDSYGWREGRASCWSPPSPPSGNPPPAPVCTTVKSPYSVPCSDGGLYGNGQIVGANFYNSCTNAFQYSEWYSTNGCTSTPPLTPPVCNASTETRSVTSCPSGQNLTGPGTESRTTYSGTGTCPPATAWTQTVAPTCSSPPAAPTCSNPTAYYYYHNPDVQAAGMDARSHWDSWGYREGRASCWPSPPPPPSCTANTETRSVTTCGSGLTLTTAGTETRTTYSGSGSCPPATGWSQTVAPVCSPPPPVCNSSTETRAISTCPSGQVLTSAGSERRTVYSGTGTCPPASGWTQVSAPVCSPPPCTSSTETRPATACPSGYTLRTAGVESRLVYSNNCQPATAWQVTLQPQCYPPEPPPPPKPSWCGTGYDAFFRLGTMGGAPAIDTVWVDCPAGTISQGPTWGSRTSYAPSVAAAYATASSFCVARPAGC